MKYSKHNILRGGVSILSGLLVYGLPSFAQGLKTTKSYAKPVIFAEGIISTPEGYETHAAFSPSGDTVYFLRCTADIMKSEICVSYKINGQWSKPDQIPFSGGKYFDADPFVTKDGNTIYFTSNRPVNEGDSIRPDTEIWRVEKANAFSWGNPVHLDSPVNSSGDEYYPTIADNGNMYFGSGREGGRGGCDIYCAKFNNGQFNIPEAIDIINSPNNEYEPFISRDEDYLIFMATIPKGLENADLYISYNNMGSWSKPIKLNLPINSPFTEWAPKVTRDGKYFFFGSTRKRTPFNGKGEGMSDVFQVDIKSLGLEKILSSNDGKSNR